MLVSKLPSHILALLSIIMPMLTEGGKRMLQKVLLKMRKEHTKDWGEDPDWGSEDDERMIDGMRKEVVKYLQRMPACVVLEMEDQRLKRKRQREEAKKKKKKDVVPMADDDESGSGRTTEREDAKEFWDDVAKRVAANKRARASASSAPKSKAQGVKKSQGAKKWSPPKALALT